MLAGEPAPALTLGAADSIHYYLLILEEVSSDAKVALGFQGVDALAECTSLLERLRTMLEDLRHKLDAEQRKPKATIQDQLNALRRNLQLVDGSNAFNVHSVLVNSLPSTMSALGIIAGEIAKDCDLDPDGSIRSLLDQIFRELDTENTALEKFHKIETQYQKEVARIDDAFEYCRRRLEAASFSLALAREQTSGSLLADAGKAIGEVQTQLEHFPVLSETPPRATTGQALTAHETLRKLLDAILHSLEKLPALKLAAYGRSDASRFGSFEIDQSNANLVQYVHDLVHNSNPRYFLPGIGLQVINCIAVCWPVWVFYLGENDGAMRKGLIESALNLRLVWGVQGDRIGEVAEKLQHAYLRASATAAAVSS